ncbi:hypothetical protein KHA80_14220 [Anaerobacillus sp. HL2]|nr:hypothetical protein KHA80_14220 [Anaerobacillus sp. HL2]
MNRYETLIDKKQLVNDESKEDTLLDIAGYYVLTLAQKMLKERSS